MAYHPFERIISLWLHRVKGYYVLENFPIRYSREKTNKYSPGTATTDFDLIFIKSEKPDELNIAECKSNINETFHNNSRDRLLKQLQDEQTLITQLPFCKTTMKLKQHVYGIKIADRVKKKIPKDIEIIEGEKLKNTVIDELIMYIGRDCKIDPKDDVLSIIRLFWHFGVFKDEYYKFRAKEIIKTNAKISPNKLREEIGLIRNLTSFCKKIKMEITTEKKDT